MRSLESGPLAREWTPGRVVNLASASVIDPLCDTLNQLGWLDPIHEEISAVARELFNGGGRRKDQREDMSRRLNAAAVKVRTIQIAAGAE